MLLYTEGGSTPEKLSGFWFHIDSCRYGSSHTLSSAWTRNHNNTCVVGTTLAVSLLDTKIRTRKYHHPNTYEREMYHILLCVLMKIRQKNNGNILGGGRVDCGLCVTIPRTNSTFQLNPGHLATHDAGSTLRGARYLTLPHSNIFCAT